MNSQDIFADLSSKGSSQAIRNEEQSLVPQTGMFATTLDTQDSGLGSSSLPATLATLDSGSGGSVSLSNSLFKGQTQIAGLTKNYTQNEHTGDITNVHGNVTNIYMGQDHGKRKNGVSEGGGSASKKSKDGDDEPDVLLLQLPQNIRAFKDKKLHKKKLIFEGEKKTLGRPIPLAVKLVEFSDAALREAEMLQKVRGHPNVVSIHDAGIHSEGKIDYFTLAMDLCSKENLYDYVRRKKQADFNPYLAISHATQLISGLKYLHLMRVIHRDLKPHNILFALRDGNTSYDQIKIADFGTSKELERDSFDASQTAPVTASRGYMAPEVLRLAQEEEEQGEKDEHQKKEREKISPKTDVFCLGILLSFCLTNGLHPYGKNPLGRDHKIADADEPDLSNILIDVAKEEIQSLLKWMLEHKPEDRPTMDQVDEEWQSIMVEIRKRERAAFTELSSSSEDQASDSQDQDVVLPEDDSQSPQEIASGHREATIVLFGGGRVHTLDITAENKMMTEDVAPILTSLSTQSYTTALIGRNLYAISWMRFVYKLDLDRVIRGWDRVRSTKFLHGKYPPVGVLKDKIYVCGGGWNHNMIFRRTGRPFHHASNSCEVYCPDGIDTTPWEPITEMRHKRACNSIVALADCLYSIGGWDMEKEAMESVERYCPESNEWTEVAKLNVARYAAGVTAFNGKIFVLGGTPDNFTYLESIESFNPMTDTWTLLDIELSLGRVQSLPFVQNNKIYVIGGRNVEIVDVEEEERERLENAIPFNVRDLAASVAALR